MPAPTPTVQDAPPRLLQRHLPEARPARLPPTESLTVNDSNALHDARSRIIRETEDMIERTLPPVSRVTLADWAIRENLPTHLEVAGLSEPASTLRGLPPLADITDRGRLLGWPGIVQHIRSLRADCLPLRKGAHPLRRKFFQVNEWVHSDAWASSPEERDRYLAVGISVLRALSPSRLGSFVTSIQLSCEVSVCIQHAIDGGTDMPEKLIAVRRETIADLLRRANLESPC